MFFELTTALSHLHQKHLAKQYGKNGVTTFIVQHETELKERKEKYKIATERNAISDVTNNTHSAHTNIL